MTDADAVLGYLPADGFAGGRMHLDVDAADAAIRTTSPSRSASTSPTRRGASSAS